MSALFAPMAFASMAFASWLAQAAPAAPAATTFTLRISIVADASGAPAARPEWVEEEIAQAQQLFAPFGVGFVRADGPALDARVARVETRADRDAFGRRVAPHVIDLFVVESLRDVDTPERMRRGVHWHAPSGAHYLLVVAGAPSTVLAHELGHYFGNPHSPVPDNVMSYERTGAPVFFDAAQGRRIAAHARAYVERGELVPIAR